MCSTFTPTNLLTNTGGRKMKKIMFIILVGMLVNLSALANKNLKADYYILVSGEMNNCKSIHFRTNDIKAVLENDEELFISKSQIKAIKANGKYYEKLPVYINNKPTDQQKFMEFITTRGGLKLYKYTDDMNRDSRLKGFNLNGFQMDYYVVFKGDQYWVEITDKNYPTMFDFFGIKYNES
jgi:hypothetical protein